MPQGMGIQCFLKNRCTSSDVDGYSFMQDRAQGLKTLCTTLQSILAQVGECDFLCARVLPRTPFLNSNLLTLLI